MNAKNKLPLFDFVSQGKHLSVPSGTCLSLPLAQCSLDDLFSTYGDQDAIICGIIPFDPKSPSTLIHSTDYSFTPHQKTVSVPEPDLDFILATEDDNQINRASALSFRQAVEEALTEISSGDYQKIVLSWKKTLDLATAPENIAAFDHLVFDRLNRNNPHADVFRVPLSGHETWIGASPEVLVDLHSGSFTTHPLAGSIAAHQAKDLQEAQKILLHSPKDLFEHSLVVEHILKQLELFDGIEISRPSGPEVMSTDSMWHLGTPIRAQVPPGISSLDLAASLHPTPAVCGAPQALAQHRISQLESYPRGYYSGIVGWADSQGNGRWSLVLRCLQRVSSKVNVFAGAGIVSGSDPAKELAETQAKMQTVLAALKASVPAAKS
ncbi:isochorismate synthase [Rothia sp. P4278]|uniref:isochorismate synthase n=1 Tax=Rothia sp. P4278 TaxID=3402658 RepID=UPI003AEEAF60